MMKYGLCSSTPVKSCTASGAANAPEALTANKSTASARIHVALNVANLKKIPPK